MDKLAEVIKTRTKDGKITCKDAFDIAEELNIKRIEVGKKLDEMKIKIKGCQLGCF